MNILEGLLFINSVDVFTQFGAFLIETKRGDNKNYAALLAPAKSKQHNCVNFREEDGEKYPDILTPALEARDITLLFAITAGSLAAFLQNYSAFIRMLRNGQNGWINLIVPELNKTYKLIYQSCSDWDQITDLDAPEVIATFKVKFREPKPSY